MGDESLGSLLKGLLNTQNKEKDDIEYYLRLSWSTGFLLASGICCSVPYSICLLLAGVGITVFVAEVKVVVSALEVEIAKFVVGVGNAVLVVVEGIVLSVSLVE